MAPGHDEIDCLSREVNLLKPSTLLMRDHLKVIWTGFTAWALLTFGSPVLTYFAPATMTVRFPVIGFPLHYFLIAVLSPTSSLMLALTYSRKRDQLDERYGINRTASQTHSKSESEAAVADRGRVG